LQNDSPQGSDNMSVDSTMSREELLYMTEVKNGTFIVEGKSINEYRQMAIEARIKSVRLENTYTLQRKVDPDLVKSLDSILLQLSKPATYGFDKEEQYEHAAVLKKEFEGWYDYWDDQFFEIQSSIIDEEGRCKGYVEPQREWIDVSTMEISVEKSSEELTVAIGAIVSFPVKSMRPREVRDRAFKTFEKGQRIENCKVIRRELVPDGEGIEVPIIYVTHPDIPTEFYAREERVQIDGEGHPN